MKKFVVLLCLVICISILTGCFSLIPTSDNSESTVSSQPISMSDIDILTKSGHPKYLDDVDVARSFWKDEMERDRIKEISGVYESVYGEDILLTFESYDDESVNKEYIGRMKLYFDHCNEKISLDKAVDIVETYLPIDTINQYYNETESYYEKSDEYECITYWKYYDLKDKNGARPSRVDINFCVMFSTDLQGNVYDASIGMVVTQYDPEITKNWDYQFFS